MPDDAWQLVPGCDLHWRVWDDEAIVYDNGSGDTHLLNQVTAATLQALQNGPKTLSDLYLHINTTCGVELDDAFRASMNAMIDELQKLGLVEHTLP